MKKFPSFKDVLGMWGINPSARKKVAKADDVHSVMQRAMKNQRSK